MLANIAHYINGQLESKNEIIIAHPSTIKKVVDRKIGENPDIFRLRSSFGIESDKFEAHMAAIDLREARRRETMFADGNVYGFQTTLSQCTDLGERLLIYAETANGQPVGEDFHFLICSLEWKEQHG